MSLSVSCFWRRKGQPAHCVIICSNSFRTSSISLLTANKARDIFAREPIRNRPAIQTPVTVVVFLTTKRQPVFPAGYSSYSTAPTHLLLTPPKPVTTTFPPPPRHAPSSALPADYPFDLATAEPASSVSGRLKCTTPSRFKMHHLEE
jgi:hypothetical protein